MTKYALLPRGVVVSHSRPTVVRSSRLSGKPLTSIDAPRGLCPWLRRRPLSSSSYSSSSGSRCGSVSEGAASLRRLLDSRIVGHNDTKECLLLGLASREHVFVQGEPGTAKTYAAELAASAAGLKSYSVQFHRDTRLQDLIGESVILREPRAGGGSGATSSAEIVRQSVERGGLLTADVAVLDDVTRAPGEALNVLLRILNERTYGGEALPLRCAIATANSPRDDMYVEPLDPANLDRFALQVRSDGLIFGNDWDSVGDVVDMYSSGPAAALVGDGGAAGGSGGEVAIASSLAAIDVESIRLGPEVRDCLCLFLRWLADHPTVTPRNSLLTDRTFLVKAPRILRAKAALDGRDEVMVKDMQALRHVTTFRVPTVVHEEVCELLRLLAETSPSEESDDNDENDDGDGDGGSGRTNELTGYMSDVLKQFQRGGPGGGGGGSRRAGSGPRPSTPSKDQESMMRAVEDDEDDDGTRRDRRGRKRRNRGEADDDDENDKMRDAVAGTSILHASVASLGIPNRLREGVFRPLRRWYGAARAGPNVKLHLDKSAVSGAESVMSVLHGRMRRSRNPAGDSSSPMPGSVGPPRKRGRMKSLSDPNLLYDADVADVATWLSDPTSDLPRGLLRHPRSRGGSVAFARDVSDSMWGARAALGSAVTQAAINLARRHRMRFGYCEFAGAPKLYKQRSRGHDRRTMMRVVPSSDVVLDHFADQSSIDSMAGASSDAVGWSARWDEWGEKVGQWLGVNIGGMSASASGTSCAAGHFFGVDYGLCEVRARRLDTDGYTNLQETLRQVLRHFQMAGLPPYERHLVIVTDGSPTVGSVTCAEEAVMARSLGVSVHPIFVSGKLPPGYSSFGDKGIGTHTEDEDYDDEEEEYPEVLKFLAEETNGVRFLARHAVTLDERVELEHDEYAHLVTVQLEVAE